ncbi:MAG: hypothetical protein MJZ38_04950, partial [archaeon]|nr:hypothetical protein [archaeon]
MSRRKSVKKPAGPNKISDQILSQDYWEGFYALSDHGIVRVEDADGTNASYEVYALSTGESVSTGTFPFTETTTFGELAGHIAKETGRNVTLRISDAAMNPDRHEEIRRILETGDRFQLARVQNLIRRIRSRGICLLGGRMGGRLIEDGEYEGFYLLEDGGVLYCREAREWDETSMPGVVDGAVSYFILRPERFDLGAARE